MIGKKALLLLLAASNVAQADDASINSSRNPPLNSLWHDERFYSLSEPDEDSCFTYEDPPACSSSSSNHLTATIDDDIDLNQECVYLLDSYLAPVAFQHEFHIQALASIRNGTKECDMAQRAYHHCYFCAAFLLPEDQASLVKDSFCWPSCPGGSDFWDWDIDAEEACNQLEEVYNQSSYPATVELCYLQEVTSRQCDDYCRRFPPEPDENSCFTYEDPPSCLNSTVSSSEDVNVNLECANLAELLWFAPYDHELHVQALASIQQGTWECAMARQVYHLCYFCAPYVLPEGAKELVTDSFCEVNSCAETRTFPKNDTIDKETACATLDGALYEEPYWLFTVELCYLQQLVYWDCMCPPPPSETSCFTYEDPPSCLSGNGTDIYRSILLTPLHRKASVVCDDLFFTLWQYSLVDDHSLHVDGLSEIEANTTECSEAREFYHLCSFCAPLVLPNLSETAASITEWYLDPECENGPQVQDATLFPVEDKNATCKELELITFPFTLEARYLRELMVHECEFFCSNETELEFPFSWEFEEYPVPNETSCWTYEDPPSCEDDSFGLIAPTTSDSIFNTIESEAYTTCLHLDGPLFQLKAYFDFDVHVNVFAELQKNTSECDAARRAYRYCFWCTPPPKGKEKLPSDYCAYSCSKEGRLQNQTDNPEALCSDIDFLLTVTEFVPVTIDSCRLFDPVLPWCDNICGENETQTFSFTRDRGSFELPNITRARTVASNDTAAEFIANRPNLTNSSCYDEDDPPSCDQMYNYEIVSKSIDVQEACSVIEQYYLAPHGLQFLHEEHVYAFAEMEKTDPRCIRTKRVYHLCYFCRDRKPVKKAWCSMDFNECRVDGRRNPGLGSNVNVKETCDELQDLFDKGQHPATTDLCNRAKVSLFSCEFWCNSYLGADTNGEKQALVWLARASALLSLIGAVYIIYDVKQQPSSKQTVYHDLLLGMGVFDIVTALGWVVATAAIPKDEAGFIMGAIGNEWTCRTQAFFIQLGLTSVFFNVSLAVYYVLVVVRSWRASDLKAIRVYLLSLPILVGVGLALSVIKYASWIGYACHVLPPPDGEAWQSYVFVVIPIGFSIVSITVSMLYMYADVQKKSRASRRWSFGVGSRKSLETQVFWRALLYTLSFYVTWPLMFAVYMASLDYRVDSFALSACVATLAPLQGFNNFLVYVRPRVTTAVRTLTSRIQSGFSSATNSQSAVMSTSTPEDASAPVDPSAAIELRRRRNSRNRSGAARPAAHPSARTVANNFRKEGTTNLNGQETRVAQECGKDCMCC